MGIQCVAGRKNIRALNAVAQFTHVARPQVIEQRLLGTRRQYLLRPRILLRDVAQEAPRVPENILGALAQRGHTQMHDVHAVEQVLAKRSLLDQLFQVAMGGTDEAEIHGNALLATEPRDGPLLQHTEQLDLHCQRHVANFVQEQRAASGLFQQSVLESHRTGKGSPLVPEQLRLQQVLRDSAAVHGDERLARA